MSIKLTKKEFNKEFLTSNTKQITIDSYNSNKNQIVLNKVTIEYNLNDNVKGGTKMTEERVIELIHEHVPPMIESAISKAVNEMKSFMIELVKPIYERLDRIEERLDRVEARLDRVEARLDRVEERLNRVEKDIQDIKNCPTIKKELQNE